jgi:hypothetical protein
MVLMVTFTNLEGSCERIDLDICKWHRLFRVIKYTPPPDGFPSDVPIVTYPAVPPVVRWIFETRDNPPRWILAWPITIARGWIATIDGRLTPGIPPPSPDWPFHEIGQEQTVALMESHDYPLPGSLTGRAITRNDHPARESDDGFEKVPSVRALERAVLDGAHDDVPKTAKTLRDLKIISAYDIRKDKCGRRTLWVKWVNKPEGIGRRRRNRKSAQS